MSDTLKVGKKYRLRSAKSLLKQYKTYGDMPHSCTEDMQKLLGTMVTITTCSDWSEAIYIKEDDEHFSWHSDYFEAKYSELNERM